MDLSETHFSADKRHPWEYARLEVVYSLLKRKKKGIKEPVIVDVGCGDVFFLVNIQKKIPGSELYGVDNAFTESSISKIKSEYQGFEVNLTDSIDKLQLKRQQTADIIFLLDVIEHIEDDIVFLKKLQNQPYIGKDTLLIISVPAYQSLFSHHDVLLGHYRRYTNKSLRKTLEAGGFKLLENGYFFSSLILPRVVSLAKEQLVRPTKENTDVAVWNKGLFITSAIKNLLILDFKISSLLRKFGIKLPGLSNYALCQKTV